MLARSAHECLLYFQVNPCACGALLAVESQGVFESSGGLVARYAGPCAACGRQNEFAFDLDPEVPALDSYGGERPSEIICPGQFALHSDQLGLGWLADPSQITGDKVGPARHDLIWAMKDLEEVAKFVVEGAVPEAAFTSVRGRELYQAEPGRFRRMRLAARIEAYRRVLVSLGE